MFSLLKVTGSVKYLTFVLLIINKIFSLIFVDNVNNPLSSLCDDICDKAFQNGLLVVHTGRESIKLAPPLTINEDALLEGIDVLKECIQDAIKERF